MPAGFLLGCSSFYQELANTKAESRRTAISVPSEFIPQRKERSSLEIVERYEPITGLVQAASLSAADFTAFDIHRGGINALLVKSSGKEAFTGGVDGQVLLNRLDTSSGVPTLETELLLKGSKPILALALSPNEKFLAVSQWSLVTLYDLENHSIVSQLSKVRGRITALAWDPKGELLALGRANGDIFVWEFGEDISYAADSESNLETYIGNSSPVTALIFHPLGRTLISAEQSGAVNMWRLLRTERELQLRGDDLASEQSANKVMRRNVASVNARVEDLWLDPDGSYLYIGASNGNIYGRKLRGLVADAPILGGDDGLISLTGVSLPWSIAPSPVLSPAENLLVTSGRQHRVKFWCKYAAIKQGPEAISQIDTALAESPSFLEPVTRLRVAPKSQTLWAVQKTGKLIIFDSRKLFNAPGWREQVDRCAKITSLVK